MRCAVQKWHTVCGFNVESGLECAVWCDINSGVKEVYTLVGVCHLKFDGWVKGVEVLNE